MRDGTILSNQDMRQFKPNQPAGGSKSPCSSIGISYPGGYCTCHRYSPAAGAVMPAKRRFARECGWRGESGGRAWPEGRHARKTKLDAMTKFKREIPSERDPNMILRRVTQTNH